jgi:hypothetical protein
MEDDYSQAFHSCANWESLKWVCYHSRWGWRQAVVYRRKKAANFHWAQDHSSQPPSAAWARMSSLCVACVYIYQVTWRALKQQNLLVCAHHTHFEPSVFTKETSKIVQNASFTFLTQRRGREKLSRTETSSSVWFLKNILKEGQSILAFTES